MRTAQKLETIRGERRSPSMTTANINTTTTTAAAATATEVDENDERISLTSSKALGADTARPGLLYDSMRLGKAEEGDRPAIDVLPQSLHNNNEGKLLEDIEEASSSYSSSRKNDDFMDSSGVDRISYAEESPLLTAIACSSSSSPSAGSQALLVSRGATAGGNFSRTNDNKPFAAAEIGNSCRFGVKDDDESTGNMPYLLLGEPLLPKTFTEPSNLSELLKNASATFHKKITGRRQTAVSPSESFNDAVDSTILHTKHCSSFLPCRANVHSANANNCCPHNRLKTMDESAKNDAYGYIDDNEDVRFEGKKLKNQLLQGSSSFHLRQKDSSSKINDTCGQCPRCSRHGRFNSMSPTLARFTGDLSCTCRICRLLDPDTSPSLRAIAAVPTTSRHLQTAGHELGALCQLCGHSDAKTFADGRCSRFVANAASSAAGANSTVTCDVTTDAANSGLVTTSNSFAGGLITCREQGVQVSKWSLSSVSSCSGPLCRICHSPGDKIEALMSPCRCSGSLKHVHMSCLLRWLEISRRKLHRAPHCELCGYKYQRHKIMRFRRFQCPPCSRRDKILHVTFVLSILIMIVCACTTIIFFKGDKHNNTKNSDRTTELTGQEIVTLICGVMFFCAFFLAMYVQVKAQATIYKLMMRFWMMNQEWHIEEYRRDRDVDYRDVHNNTSDVGSDV